MKRLRNIFRFKDLALYIKFCAEQMIKKKEKNSDLVNILNSGLKDLEGEIKEMSEKEIETEKPDEIVRVVKMILDFNKQNQERKRLRNFNTKSNA